ncbi:hypothetical protein C0Q70_20648 [Pomacea canaliculata]|uniref:BESS domain-containing protein n=2 Tax=Pomacea canaliculata TaxID=400727 RepID=A0A2T7NG53_POMCA|nr:hypothetical protein C0Q70_20648 [Pomacea canaliculata]
MRSLRTSLLQQLWSYNARCKSEASACDVAEPIWRFWKALHFLRPFIKTRKGQDNLSFASTNSSESSERPLVTDEETGDIRVLLTSVGASSGETAEATAAPPSPNVYQQTPSPQAPDCAQKWKDDISDTPSEAAAPPSPKVYEQTPPPQAPDCAQKWKDYISDTPSEAVSPPSPNAYQQTPPPKVPDCAKKRRRVEKLDTTSPAAQAVEILKNLQKAREKAMEESRKATQNELFYQMVARTTENFPEDIRYQLQFDIFKMIHEIRVKSLNTNSLEK